MPATSFVRVGLLLAVLVVVACSPQGRLAATRPNAAALLVENRSAHDVVVYLADGHVPMRLGRVGALGRSRLAIPGHAVFASGIRMLVRSTSSAEVFATDPVLPRAGALLELTVQPLLTQTTLSVLSFGG